MITKNKIEALMDEKGNPKKCPECFGTRKTPARRMDCRKCKGTGQATIEIKKEWVGWSPFAIKQKETPKHNVGDEIWVDTKCKPYTHLGKCEHKIKLKIISETEITQRLMMVR